MLTHTSLIDRYDPPRYFRDVMVSGRFRSFEHEHSFEPAVDGSTVMHDRLRFSAPFGVAGRLTEHVVLRPYLINFLQQRNAVIRRVAESPTEEWRRYLS
jgi:ligand-binding SRPBCC domain-containing protein